MLHISIKGHFIFYILKYVIEKWIPCFYTSGPVLFLKFHKFCVGFTLLNAISWVCFTNIYLLNIVHFSWVKVIYFYLNGSSQIFLLSPPGDSNLICPKVKSVPRPFPFPWLSLIYSVICFPHPSKHHHWNTEASKIPDPISPWNHHIQSLTKFHIFYLFTSF